MKSFLKNLIDFLRKGWVNFLIGVLLLFISLGVFFWFRHEPDYPSLFLGFFLFSGSDIMGYGLCKFFSSKKAT